MIKIVGLTEFRDKQNREDMIDVLEKAIERVRTGEAIGTVVAQTTDDPLCTYNSVGGKCMSLLMLATLQVLVTKIAIYTDENSESML